MMDNLFYRSAFIFLTSCLLFSCAYRPVDTAAGSTLIIEEQSTPTQIIHHSPIRFLNWNIHKEQNNPEWQREIMDPNCTHNPDIFLFQEVQMNAHLKNILKTKQLNWKFVPNGIRNNEYVGVLTASKSASAFNLPIVSSMTEPFTNTPKSALITSYMVNHNGVPTPLIIANIHAINFVSLTDYHKQVETLYHALFPYRNEAMIVAGDVNTWSSGRVDILNRYFGLLGLKEMPINDQMLRQIKKPGFISILPFIENLPLDRVYYSKALRILNAEVLECPTSSDHKPIYIDFILKE